MTINKHFLSKNSEELIEKIRQHYQSEGKPLSKSQVYKRFDKAGVLIPKNIIEYSGTVGSESINWVYFEVMVVPENLDFDPNIAKDNEPVILWSSSSNRLSIFYGTINLKNDISKDPSAPIEVRKVVEQVNKLLLNTMLVLNSKPELLDKQESELYQF